MIESFENPKIQKVNASIAAKSSKKGFVSEGNYSVRLEPASEPWDSPTVSARE